MAIYVSVSILVLLGMKQPIIVYPLGFFAAYIVVFNLKERFKGKEEESAKTILLLAFTFSLVAILFAVGPALIISFLG